MISLLEEDIFYAIRLYTLLVLNIYFGIECIDKFKSYTTNKLLLKISIY